MAFFSRCERLVLVGWEIMRGCVLEIVRQAMSHLYTKLLANHLADLLVCCWHGLDLVPIPLVETKSKEWEFSIAVHTPIGKLGLRDKWIAALVQNVWFLCTCKVPDLIDQLRIEK